MKTNHPLQREWDALMILYWRKNKQFAELSSDFKARHGVYPNDVEGLLRTRGYFAPHMYVRAWVDSWLRPLSDKLWDVEDNLRVLNWLNASTGLDCSENLVAGKERRARYYEAKKSKLEAQAEDMVRANTYHRQNRMENPNRVKAVRNKR